MHAHRPVFPVDRTFVPPETYDAFFAVVERIEAVLAAETAALAAQRHHHLADLTRQKRQGFLELNRIARQLAAAIPSQEIIARLAAFSTVLEANAAMLRTHMRAVKGVTDIIVKVMREAESDGTYSRAHGRADYGQA